MRCSGMAAALLALAGCAGGGGARPADSPGACPGGTVLKGSDCLPADSAGDDSSSTTAKGGGASSAADEDESSSAAVASATGSTPYDKDAVDAELKRAARQVKANCGAATDDQGQATGPWGQTKATIVLGRNGHVKQVSVPEPYDGKPVGVCVVHAFQKIWFPPYAAPSDVTVEWDIDLLPPKK